MRTGKSPAKSAEARCAPPKGVTLAFVIWVPHLDGYFRGLLEVFRLALLSARANTSIPFDVLVVDNASCDAVDRFIRDEMHEGAIQYHLRSDRNLGVVNATVQALRAAPGGFVAYADCDVFFRERWLEQLIAVKQAFPEAGLVSGVPLRRVADGQLENARRVFGSDRDTVAEEGDLIPREILREWAESIGWTIEDYLAAPRIHQSDLRLTRGAVTAYAGGSHFAYLTTADVIDRAAHPRTDKLVQPRAVGFDMRMTALGVPWISTPEPVFFHMGNYLAEEWVQSDYVRLVGRRPPPEACVAARDSPSRWRRRWARRKLALVTSRFLREEYGLSGSDLAARARRVLLDEVEHVGCSLCGSDEPEIVAERDRYGLPVHAVMCRRCGLMYLTPRPSADCYRVFRESGRDGVAADYDELGPGELEQVLCEYFGPDFSMRREVRKRLAMVPAGGSAQRSRDTAAERSAFDIYDAAREFVPFGGAVFEQSAIDSAYLVPWRVQHACTAEAGGPTAAAYDLVFSGRAIDHQTDPLDKLREAHRILKPGGVVFVQALDVIEVARRTGHHGLRGLAVDIDHPQMFTERTLRALVQAGGFEIVRSTVTLMRGVRGGSAKKIPRIYVFGRKTDSPVAVDWPTFEHEWAELTGTAPENGGLAPDSRRGTPETSEQDLIIRSS